MSIVERAVEAAKQQAPADRPSGDRRRDTSGQGKAVQRIRLVSSNPVIAFSSLAERGTLISEASNRDVFEGFRRLKRPIMQTAYGPLAPAGANLLMVTSPLDGDGKTFVSINLADALALEKERDVVLIDMDNARRSLSVQLGLVGKPGFFDLVHEPGISLSDVIYPTDRTGLFVIPAGEPAPDSLERLNSGRCRQLLRDFTSEDPTRVVLLDTPPLLVTNEGPAIAALAGQIVLVVQAGKTPKSCVEKALELLSKDKPVGMILNKTPGKVGPGFYYADA